MTTTTKNHRYYVDATGHPVEILDGWCAAVDRAKEVVDDLVAEGWRVVHASTFEAHLARKGSSIYVSIGSVDPLPVDPMWHAPRSPLGSVVGRMCEVYDDLDNDPMVPGYQLGRGSVEAALDREAGRYGWTLDQVRHQVRLVSTDRWAHRNLGWL